MPKESKESSKSKPSKALINQDKKELKAKTIIDKLTGVTMHAMSNAICSEVDKIWMQTDINSFYLNEELAKQFENALKAGVKAEFQLLHSIMEDASKKVMPLILSQVALNAIANRESIESQALQLVVNLRSITRLPHFTDKPENLTIKELKKRIQSVDKLTDQEFKSRLEGIGITLFPIVMGLIEYKHDIVAAYKRYFELADQHCKKADLDEESLDAVRLALYSKIKHNPISLVQSFLHELMLAYTDNPEIHDHLLVTILGEANAGDLSMNKLLGCNQPFDLSEQAKYLPTYVQAITAASSTHLIEDTQDKSKKSVDADEKKEKQSTSDSQQSAVINQEIKLNPISTSSSAPVHSEAKVEQVKLFFQHAGEINQRFQNAKLPITPSYQDISEKIKAQDVVNQLLNHYSLTHGAVHKPNHTEHLNALNALYVAAKPWVNRHKHNVRDALFLLKNTKTWQIVMGKIRNQAYEVLLSQLKTLENPESIITRLEEAREMPIFKEHRSNYKLSGAFGRTKTVKLIDEQIASYKAQLNEKSHHKASFKINLSFFSKHFTKRTSKSQEKTDKQSKKTKDQYSVAEEKILQMPT